MIPSSITLLSPESAAFPGALAAGDTSGWADPSTPYRLADHGELLTAQSPAGIGLVGLVKRPAYLKGELVSLAIIRDLTVEPAARGQGMARMLTGAALEHARSLGAQVAVVASPTSDPPLRFLRDDPAFGPFKLLGRFLSLRIIPALWRWEEPEYKVFKATSQDWQALAYLVDLYHQTLAFGLPVQEAEFKKALTIGGNQAVTDFRLARYKGELAGITGVWEPGTALPVRQGPYSPTEALIATIGRTLRRFSPVPRLPRGGAPLRVRLLNYYAFKQGHPRCLGYLFDRIANETRKAGAHALEVTLPYGDPMLESLRGRVRKVATRSVWGVPLVDSLSLDDLGPIDPGLLEPTYFLG